MKTRGISQGSWEHEKTERKGKSDLKNSVATSTS